MMSTLRTSKRGTGAWSLTPRAWSCATALLLFCAAVRIAAQAPAAAPAAVDTVEADPIRCWWRASTSAVRVGEPFTIVLTCAVIENDTAKVVPDQSRLEPSVMQFAPFEVIGGQRGIDLHSGQRRFFQYQYTLRLINTEAFGSDVKLPSVQISYQVENRVEKGEAIRGREHTYALPDESIRIISQVPANASDIRDVPSWTFGDIDAQRFRARVLFVVAAILGAVAALILAVALVGLARRFRQPAPVGARLLSDTAVLSGVARELAAVRRAAGREGWSEALAGRALAALRIAATIALGQRLGQRLAASDPIPEGHVVMRGGLLRGKKVLVSGSATAEAVAQEELKGVTQSTSPSRQQCLETLQRGLALLTTMQFGRDTKLDPSALDEAVAGGIRAIRYLRIQSLGPVRKFRTMTQFGVELGNRVWSR